MTCLAVKMSRDSASVLVLLALQAPRVIPLLVHPVLEAPRVVTRPVPRVDLHRITRATFPLRKEDLHFPIASLAPPRATRLVAARVREEVAVAGVAAAAAAVADQASRDQAFHPRVRKNRPIES